MIHVCEVKAFVGFIYYKMYNNMWCIDCGIYYIKTWHFNVKTYVTMNTMLLYSVWWMKEINKVFYLIGYNVQQYVMVFIVTHIYITNVPHKQKNTLYYCTLWWMKSQKFFLSITMYKKICDVYCNSYYIRMTF
jgi:hypothetical protein